MTEGLEALPPLREVIARHRLSARKALGQNFLLDLNLTRRIARAAGPLEGVQVIEVGPGPGGLTRALLLEGADHVVAIERDARVIPVLEEISVAAPGRLTIVQGDALQADYDGIASDRETIVVANLPYNVGTPLLVGWLTAESWPPWWKRLTLMFQREVAERIVAAPDSKAYGRLSVLAGWRGETRILFDVPARAFTPTPKVTSSMVRIVPRLDAEPVLPASLERVTAVAFGQRRKMLRSSLKSLWREPQQVLEAVGIAPEQRAEEVPVASFVRLARIYEEMRSDSYDGTIA